MICSGNQLTGFYLIGISVIKELKFQNYSMNEKENLGLELSTTVPHWNYNDVIESRNLQKYEKGIFLQQAETFAFEKCKLKIGWQITRKCFKSTALISRKSG